MTAARWYCVNNFGMATLAVDKEDAEKTARDSDTLFPRHAPHRAVQLVELTPERAAAAELLASLRECVEDTQEVISQHIAAYGENCRADRLKHMREQLARAKSAIAKAEGK